MFKFLLPSDRRVWLAMPLVAMFLFIGGSTAASAATVYINFGGSNGTQNGQESTPYTTTAQFTSNVVAGDTVYVKGTLTSTLTISSLVGTASAPTRVQLWPGETTRLSITTSSGSALDIADSRYVEVSGMDISGSIHGIFVHKTTGTSSNITLSDLSTKSTNTGSALQVSDTSTISISSVTSTNSLGNGISIDSGNSNVTVSNVTITNPTSVGIGTTSQTAGVTTMTIDSSTVTGAGSVGIQCTNSSTGFSVTNSTVTGSGDVTSGKQNINIQDCDSTVIRGNVVRSASGSGIRVSSADTVTVDRNMSSGHTGTNNPGITVTASNNTTVTNNVVYGNTLGFFIQANAVTVTGTVLSHNTIYNSSSGSVVYNEAANGSITNTTFSYNIVYTGSNQNVNGLPSNGITWNSASNYNLYYLNGVSSKMESNNATLAHWQASQGIDANSSTGDPLFTTTTSGSENLTLQNTSPAIDGAVGSTLTTDYANATRPYGASGGNDIGAYETSTPSATSVSMAAVASVSDAGVHTVTLTITDSTNPATTTYAIATNAGGTEWLTTSGGTSTSPAYSTSKTWTHTSLTANTAYSYYFRIADSDQSTYLALSSAVSASTVLSAPTAVTLTASGATTLGVSWTAPSGTVTSYTVSVGDDVLAADTTTTGITGTSTTLTGLTAATTYYVKVRAVNTAGSGVYSGVSSIATLQNPPATLTEPDPESGTLTPFSATLSWAEVYGATGYVISYGTDSLATNLGTVTVNASGEVTATANVSTTLTGLTPSTPYYWKVATVTSSGTGSYSAIATFTTSVANLGIILMPDAEQKTNIRIVDVSGTQSVSFFAYGTSMNLKVDSLTADLNGDGVLEIITTVLGPSNAVAHIRIFDSSGTFIANLFPFGGSVRGGASIAAGDFNNDGVTDLAVVPYGNVASNTRTYDFSASLTSPTVLAWKFTYGAGLKNGSLLAAGDVTGDGADDLVVWNRDRNPNVQVLTFNDTTNVLDQVAYVFPYGEMGINTGADLVLADIDGDDDKDIVTVPTGGRAIANIQVYAYTTASDGSQTGIRRNMKRLTWIQAYQEQTAGTFNLASGDINNDGNDEIVIAPYAGLGGQVMTYDYYNNQLNLIASNFPYGKDYAGGVHVALGDFDSDQKAELVTSTQNGNAPNTRVYSYGSTGWTLDDWFMAFSENARFGTRVGR